MKSNSWKGHWIKFLSGATWITAVVSPIFIKPPLSSLNDKANYQVLVHFVIAALIGLSYILMLKYSAKKYYRHWLYASFSAAALSVIIGVLYVLMINSWSVNYYGDRVVIGEHYYPESYRTKTRLTTVLNRVRIDDETLVKTYAGDTAAIWPAIEISRYYFLFVFVYTIEIVIVAIFIMTVAQSINCYESRKK